MEIVDMENELQQYGTFVVYNGLSRSCSYSRKSGEYLLKALYAIIPKENTTNFILKGGKEYLETMSTSELSLRTSVPIEILSKGKQAHIWVTNHEFQTFPTPPVSLSKPPLNPHLSPNSLPNLPPPL